VAPDNGKADWPLPFVPGTLRVPRLENSPGVIVPKTGNYGFPMSQVVCFREGTGAVAWFLPDAAAARLLLLLLMIARERAVLDRDNPPVVRGDIKQEKTYVMRPSYTSINSALAHNTL
jgi:hypothetical protein